MKTPFDLIKSLESWFFARAWDVVLADGKKLVITYPGVTVTLNGSGVVVTGGDVTIDGSSVAIAGSISHDTDLTDVSADDHHNRSHALDSASDHTGTLPWSDLNKTGSDLADLATRAHSDLTGVTADQHHNESHTVASHSDTSATGSELNTLTDGSDASSLHDHDGRYFQESEFASDPGASSKPLKSGSGGDLTLQGLVIESGVLQMEERNTPGTPPTGFLRIYPKAGGRLYYINDGGTEYGPL